MPNIQAFECSECKQLKKVENRVRVTLRYEGAVQGTSEVQEVCTDCVKGDDALSGLTDLKPFRRRKKAEEGEAPAEGLPAPENALEGRPRPVQAPLSG